RVGQQVASELVTVVDDGTIANRRGSLNVDDEGTPTGRNVLIENGILRGYMQDRLNARLMGQAPTGNGRRESYAHPPLPRMTNTFMLAGQDDPEEIMRSVKHGLYAVSFGGGQVDITSGKFVFSASEAYLIEDGRVTSPVKGATLIGNGPDALTRDWLGRAVDEATALARVTAEDPHAGLPDPADLIQRVPDLELSDPGGHDLTPEAKIEVARVAEAAALESDPRITNSEGAEYW